jgi:hypothetical protein
MFPVVGFGGDCNEKGGGRVDSDLQERAPGGTTGYVGRGGEEDGPEVCATDRKNASRAFPFSRARTIWL